MSDRNGTMNRRTFLKRMVKGTAYAAVGVPLYSYIVERNGLKVSERLVPMLPPGSSLNGLRIAHFSDLHDGHHLGVEQVRQVVEQMKALRPDLICFTGDLVDRFCTLDLTACIRELSHLRARLGCYAVLGNHDYWWDVHRVRAAYMNSGFRLLVNEGLSVGDGSERLQIAGVEDAIGGTADVDRALRAVNPLEPLIVLAHEPDLADRIRTDLQMALQLSVHSHGGQVRLPILGPLYTPGLGEKYNDGLYQLREGMYVYTNRGIGTSTIPFRLFCRPEISMITLVAKAQL